MWRKSGPSFGWLVFWFVVLLSGGFLVHIYAQEQSTNSEPAPPSESQSVPRSPASLSAELLQTLNDLRASSPELIKESQSLREQVEQLEKQLIALSSESANWEAESKRLTDSLKSLTKQFEDYREAVSKREVLDQKAIDEARGAVFWWATGSAAVSFVLAWLLHG